MLKTCWYLWMVFLGFALVRPIADPDIWWHLSIGDWIVQNKTFPLVDHWTIMGEGKPFRAYSWLPEVLFSSFFSLGGEKGLMSLLIILMTILAGSASYVCGFFLRNHRLGVLVGTLLVMGLSTHSSLRPQAFVWVYVFWLFYALERIRLREISLFWIAPIAALWANTHLSTAFGIIITSIFLLPSARLVFWGSGIFFVGTFFTPYMGGEWLTMLNKISHPISFTEIAEFQPATFTSVPVVFVMLLASTILVIMFQERALPRFSVSLLAGFFAILGLFFVKFLPFSIMSLGLLLVSVMRTGVSPGTFLAGLGKLEDFISSKVLGQGFGVLILALIIYNAGLRFSYPIYSEVLPERSVKFIIEKGLPQPILTTFSLGGYLGFSGVKPIFDGRTNLISNEFWKDYIIALQGLPGYEQFIERIKPETILWTQRSPFPELLKARGEWCRVFSEKDLFVVLVKTPSEICLE